MRYRIITVFLFIVFLWGLLVLRAAWLQIVPNQRLAQLQKRQFSTTVKLNARRGVIFDRNGQELAASISAWSLYADPVMIEEPSRTAKRLARVLGLDVKDIEKKLRDRGRRFTWLARRMDTRVRDEIAGWKVEGLGLVEEPKRIYPNESLLGQVVGFTGEEGKGLEGLESRFNADLEGEGKTVRLQRDARGRPLLFDGEWFSESPEGTDIHLTVDSAIQHDLEKELVDAVERHKAASAVGIVLDARDSKILAMASVPLFNPNETRGHADIRRNRAVTDPFEPGSIVKTFTIAGALRSGLVAPNTKIDCGNGTLKVGRRTIREADSDHKWKSLSVSEVLAHSSNIGSARIAFQLGDRRVRDTLTDFGFGEKSGVDLPGDSRGILPATPWREHLLGNIAFGHGLAATPLQIANAYAAVANGGILHRPYIVKSTGPEAIRRVLTEKEAAMLRLMLIGVIRKDATGWHARVPGFSVGGKTGTAQKASATGGYVPGAYISSFAGFLPVNDPRYVVFVAIDSPTKGYYASEVAAPVFSNIAGFLARHEGLVPSFIDEKSLSRKIGDGPSVAGRGVSSSDDSPLDRVPELRGLSLREALARVRKRDLNVEIFGSSGRIASVSPEVGSLLPADRKLVLQLQ